jgi:RimJ/RimL family protein N-acetyltransferase
MIDRYDLSPLFGLRLRTPRLELWLPAEDELAQLARVAQQGVHPRDEMPFLIPWTDDLDSPSFVEGFVGYHLQARSGWTPKDWRLELGVWRQGSLIGSQGIEAKNFARERTTTSASWLAQTYQRHGYGTEMRAAILELAFSGLGAVAAVSGALTGNVASARVSEKLGYTDAGERQHERNGEPLRERRFLIRREQWEQVEHPPVAIVSLEPCLPLFGADR